MPTILNTRVIIAKNIKMDREYKHVLNYNENEILSLLTNSENLVNQTYRASFVNETGRIRVPFTYDECLQSNYIAFQNPSYSNKWFFAFIDKVTFLAKNTQEIEYTTDIWSTWFSYLTIKPSFVVREHTNNDTIGANTVEENIDVGRIHAVNVSEETILKGHDWVAVMCSWNPATFKQFDGITLGAGTVSGSEIFLFNISRSYLPLINFIRRCNEDGAIESIRDIFIITNSVALSSQLHENLFRYPKDSTRDEDGFLFYTIEPDRENLGFYVNIPKNYTYTQYIPKNNKSKIYPYNFLQITNNVGNVNNYKYEEFSDSDNATFYIEETICIGGDTRLVPLNYNGIPKNIDESLPYGKLPVCGWSADSFTNWLTQNAINIGSRIATDVIMAYAVPEAGAGIAADAISLIGEFRKAMLAPNIERQGSNQGNINIASSDNTFVYKEMRCEPQFLEIIDNFFTMYGYKTNKIKIPNITGRRNFNFIEISPNDSLGYGSIPSMAMDTINKVARRGVTIWHNHANLGNYNVNNSII